MKRWTDVCQQMGIPLLRIIGGDIPEGQTEEQAWPWLAGYMRQIVDYAKTKQVQVGLHNHNHGMFPATGAAIVRMLDEINDPYLRARHGYWSVQRFTRRFRTLAGKRAISILTMTFTKQIETSLPRAQLVRCKAYKMASGSEEWIDYDRVFPMLNAA